LSKTARSMSIRLTGRTEEVKSQASNIDGYQHVAQDEPKFVITAQSPIYCHGVFPRHLNCNTDVERPGHQPVGSIEFTFDSMLIVAGIHMT